MNGNKPPKTVRKFFALEINPEKPESKDYLSVIGPFKNRTACEWYLENYVPGVESKTFSIQEVSKIG